MTQAKYTKGPWLLEYGEVKHRPSSIRAIEGGVSILRADAFCRKAHPETRANARLMVAAPDMYEALEWLECYANVQVRRHPDAEDSKNWALVLSALAKARGES